MASYGYIIVDLCLLSLHLNCIMQLKQFYNIATKVSSKKRATTFGDQPYWWSQHLFIDKNPKCKNIPIFSQTI